MTATPQPDEVVKLLVELADRAGIEVRIEPFRGELAGKGGFCRIDGRPAVLVDARLGTVERAGVLGLALGRARLGVEVPPVLRPYLRTGHGPLGRHIVPKPLARAVPRLVQLTRP